MFYGIKVRNRICMSFDFQSFDILIKQKKVRKMYVPFTNFCLSILRKTAPPPRGDTPRYPGISRKRFDNGSIMVRE